MAEVMLCTRESEEEVEGDGTEDEEDDDEATLESTSRGRGRRQDGRRRGAPHRRQANTAAWTRDEVQMPERRFTRESGPRPPADRDFSDPLAVFRICFGSRFVL